MQGGFLQVTEGVHSEVSEGAGHRICCGKGKGRGDGYRQCWVGRSSDRGTPALLSSVRTSPASQLVASVAPRGLDDLARRVCSLETRRGVPGSGPGAPRQMNVDELQGGWTAWFGVCLRSGARPRAQWTDSQMSPG